MTRQLAPWGIALGTGLVVAWLSFPVRAQAPAAPAAPDSAAPAPLTPLEQAQVQALNYEVQHVNDLYEIAKHTQQEADHAKADAQAHMLTLKAELEAARPGWTWHPDTGQWSATPPPKAKTSGS